MSKQPETTSVFLPGHDTLHDFISQRTVVVVIILCGVHCGFQECVQIMK